MKQYNKVMSITYTPITIPIACRGCDVKCSCVWYFIGQHWRSNGLCSECFMNYLKDTTIRLKPFRK